MTEAGHAERQHALCSASSAERWMHCPGSVGLSLTVPEPPTSSYALEGTKAHELAEKILKHWMGNGYTVEDAFLEGLATSDEEKEMLGFVMQYVMACHEQAIAFTGTPAIRIEQKLVFDEKMQMFGTADFIATGLREGISTGVIVDLKYGRGKKVLSEDNPQLAYYAVALKKMSKKKLERVIVKIVQPRINHPGSTVEFSTEDLNRWEQQLTLHAEQALWMASKHKAPEYKEGRWCWFCPAKSVCPEIQRKLNEKAAEAFPDDL